MPQKRMQRPRPLMQCIATIICLLSLLHSFQGVQARLQRQVIPANASDPLLLVNTTSGQVMGKRRSSTSYAYLGIPYGNPTNGINRFRAPTMRKYSTSIIDATDFAPACPQSVSELSGMVNSFTGSPAPPTSQQSEDCLSINVFVRTSNRAAAPALKNGTGGAAVMIWIYGGSFQYGTASHSLYDAQKFVESQPDLIVVSFDYRTNIFGFPLSPQIRTADAKVGWNRGLEDRDLAIEWVYQNIAAFGGDPNRITLFGESAGGVAVDTWAFSNANTAQPRVKGIIVQSGAVQGLDLALSEASSDWTRPSSVWNQVANHALVGCGLVNDAAQLACMQQVDFSLLVQAIEALNLQFGPAADNIRYWSDWRGRSSQGRFSRVPLMIGTNADEGTILTGLWLTDIAQMLSTSTLTTPLLFTCPAKQEATDRVAFGVPTWRYQYHGNWANMNSGITSMGSFHFSEVPIVFRTFPPHYLSDPSHTVNITQQQNAVGLWMQAAWATFARDPQNGLSKFGWPRYAPLAGRTLAHIAKNNSAAVRYESAQPLDLGCGLGVPLESGVYQLLKNLGSVF
ncbi:hypothetical protein OC846_006392 [Tilletia horrida]|uniref:Carboxylic ester hydrolase n=1 Tax=Tilletia horrida TaxID=155126 RepID=A0AAN6GIY2_9BASI|nr:hypothetical protein OC845_006421 [Tilletia horrida]KAK0543503.1 hypothetical protein OC846_006392 [Tilletia horrida]